MNADVLVVGAGPVGLALAIELGMRGVRVMLVERRARAGSAPRAKTTNVRTRTHLRRWGIADRLAAASPLGISYPNDVIFVTRLSGYPLAHFSNAFNAAPARSPHYPEHAQWIPQYTLEQVMREHVKTLPTVELIFGTTFISAAQDDEHVNSIVRDDAGSERSVTSQFLVGADGARSTVRDLIGAKMEGKYGLSRNYNIVFRAPGLAQAHRRGRGVMYWQVNRDGGSLIGPMDKDDVWFFMPTGMKEGQRLSNEEAAAAIAQATGIDLAYEILSTDEWVASRLLANRYRTGRIFLAGDACHLHPPFGGYGMNMGIGDGVDLGWKLAALIQGWGGSGLLESYEAERRPVHDIVIKEAVANHQVLGGELWQDGLEDASLKGEKLRCVVGDRILAAKAREFYTLGTVLGLGYNASPIVTYDGTPSAPADGATYVPSARPGYLAPHAWLDDGRSLYDLLGQGFSLVVTEDADEHHVQLAVEESSTLGVPLTVVRPVGVPIKSLYQADMVLIRPDQHVAWRGALWRPTTLHRAAGLLSAGNSTVSSQPQGESNARETEIDGTSINVAEAEVATLSEVRSLSS